MLIIILTLVTATGLLLSSCAEDPQRPQFAFDLNQLRAAPDTLSLEGTRLALQTRLWRDFLVGQDISLQLQVVVSEVDAREIPEEIELAQVFVINGGSVWELQSQQAVYSKTRFEKIFTGGPLWGPDIAVDVVVSLLDSERGLHLLQAREQWIESTL